MAASRWVPTKASVVPMAEAAALLDDDDYSALQDVVRQLADGPTPQHGCTLDIAKVPGAPGVWTAWFGRHHNLLLMYKVYADYPRFTIIAVTRLG